MKVRASAILVCGIVLFAGLTLFFWTAANLTHINCCSQEWINSATDPSTREVRSEARARALTETEKLKKKSKLYSVSCLTAVTGLAILYWMRRKQRTA
jgi:hypothetical protein